MKELTKEQMAYKKILDIEKYRVASYVEDAVEDINESGGHLGLFSKCLLLAHIELDTKLNGPEFTVFALNRCAETLRKKHGLAGSC